MFLNNFSTSLARARKNKKKLLKKRGGGLDLLEFANALSRPPLPRCGGGSNRSPQRSQAPCPERPTPTHQNRCRWRGGCSQGTQGSLGFVEHPANAAGSMPTGRHSGYRRASLLVGKAPHPRCAQPPATPRPHRALKTASSAFFFASSMRWLGARKKTR